MSLVSMISALATRIAAEVKLRGVPAGGATGQVVTKSGTGDYATSWANILFADPSADRIVFWDDSAKAFAPLVVSYGLLVTATVLSVRDASTTQTGIVELATSGETGAGTDTFRAVTPAGLASAFLNNVATEAGPGTVELATTTEASTGTDTARATTAAGVKAAIDARTATETAAGIVELATTTEAVTGTDTARAVTPAGVAAAVAVVGGVGANMGTPAATVSLGTVTSGTTETRDATLGNYVFTAVAGVRYEVRLNGMNLNFGVANDIFTINVRNGGASTPTATSTLIATKTVVSPTVAGMPIPVALSFVPGAGLVTLSVFAKRYSGTGTGQPAGTRELYVVNVGPA